MSYDKLGSKFRKGFRNYRVDTGFTTRVIESFLQSLDCPRALTVWILFKSNEHGQVANLGFDPRDYSDLGVAMRDAYAATKFLSKFKGLILDSDLDKAAIAKFKEFELRCRMTNSRFKDLSLDPLYKGSNVWLHHAVKRKISQILGEFDSEEFLSSPDWGPGASTLVKRRSASSQEKFQCETGITRDLHDLFPIELMQKLYPTWGQHLEIVGYPTFQVGNKVITVPKDAATNRVIAVEPGINLWFQKSLGDMMKSRLLRFGIDLTDQTRNQQLARIGSQNGVYATVDFSSASDSIASAVVEELFPPRWFLLLDSCRTKYGLLESELVKWEKFSSMGNGFNFPAQTLIFYAAALACTEYLHINESVSVYGDDVIIPTSAYKLFSDLAAFYGFQINEKKSHYDSTFRESCGAHYSSGSDIKPIYLKDRVSSIETINRLANAVRRLAHRRNVGLGCDAKLRPVFDLCVRTVPEALRLRVPEGFGDGGFVSNFDEVLPSRVRHQIEGFYVIHAVRVSVTYQEERLGYLLTELWRIDGRRPVEYWPRKRPFTLKAIRDLTELDSSVKGRNSVPTHDSVLRITKSVVRQWTDLGPWF